MPSACATCGIRTKLSACSRCKIALYCSVDCQKKSWVSHKKSCSQVHKSVHTDRSSKFHTEDDTSFFVVGEMCESTGKRYLSTVHVLTCFVIFAYDPFSKRSFGAHVHMGAMLHSMGTDAFLPELAARLRPFQTGCVVYVIGGHACEDESNVAMQKYEEKSISRKIVSFVKQHLPVSLVCTDLMLKFKGMKITTIEDEMKCCIDGHRFEILSLDTTTGHVTWDNGDCYRKRCDTSVYSREGLAFQEMMSSGGICPLVDSKHN